MRGVVSLLGLLAVPLLGQGPLFEDVSAQVGLDFVHQNGMTGRLTFPEMTGQGAALLDYDGDGDLDLYLVEGGLVDPDDRPEELLRPTPGPPWTDRLYRTDLVFTPDGRVSLRLVEVSSAAGIPAPTGYGMGVATGDYDGDGDVDLYRTAYGPNQLLQNQGDGTFVDVTRAAGVDDPRWSTSATFADLDGDRDLDLFVAAYVEFDVKKNPACYAASSRRDYCGPSDFPPLSDRLFENRGDGTFADITEASGVGARKGAGLGVVAADFDMDGRTDLYVANDGMRNVLWQARGDGTLTDGALLAGIAVNRRGEPEASMGVVAGDLDGDGDEDLYMTHLAGESDTLFLNEGGLFEDRTAETDLAGASLGGTAFGVAMVDVDLDGWLDLAMANGAVRIQEGRGDPDFPLDQPNRLVRSLAGRRFEEMTSRAGDAFTRSEVSRGLAAGDVDGDGDPDLLLANNAGPARLLLSRSRESGSHFVGIDLRTRAGAPATGARVVVIDGERKMWRRVASDGSYCSAHDPRIQVGLGREPAGEASALVLPLGSAPRRLPLRIDHTHVATVAP